MTFTTRTLTEAAGSFSDAIGLVNANACLIMGKDFFVLNSPQTRQPRRYYQLRGANVLFITISSPKIVQN
jgi:hypothetical protein